MNELLSQMVNRQIDIFCGGSSSLRGKVIKVEGGLLHLKDHDEQMCYVSIDKIVVVWEARDESEHRAGFIPRTVENR